MFSELLGFILQDFVWIVSYVQVRPQEIFELPPQELPEIQF